MTQLQFPGDSGKQFYKLIKQGAIQWKKFPNPMTQFLLYYFDSKGF